ncbi:hypothetical protein JXM67_15365 [candidate division WOR-3 bacterium]|nr:hypothetical protein [candidate division WOR-3 bacterium]
MNSEKNIVEELQDKTPLEFNPYETPETYTPPPDALRVEEIMTPERYQAEYDTAMEEWRKQMKEWRKQAREYKNTLLEEAIQDLFYSFAASTPGTQQWIQNQPSSTISAPGNDQLSPFLTKEEKLIRYFQTTLHPKDFVRDALASGSIPIRGVDPEASAPGIQYSIYYATVDPKYWEIPWELYVQVRTDTGAVSYLKTNFNVTRENGGIPGWEKDENGKLRNYIKNWEKNVKEFHETFGQVKLPETTIQNPHLPMCLRKKMVPPGFEALPVKPPEEVIQEHDLELFNTINEIKDKVLNEEPLESSATAEASILYDYFNSYVYFQAEKEKVPEALWLDFRGSKPSREISPEETIEKLQAIHTPRTMNIQGYNYKTSRLDEYMAFLNKRESFTQEENVSFEVDKEYIHNMDENEFERMLSKVGARELNKNAVT